MHVVYKLSVHWLMIISLPLGLRPFWKLRSRRASVDLREKEKMAQQQMLCTYAS